MPTRNYQGSCGRGVFGLTSWDPPRRPQALLEAKSELNKWKPNAELMVKYKYQAKPDSPLGKELTVKPKDIVYFVSEFNEHWILVELDGEQGYIPASYVMYSPETVSSLPWLDQKNAENGIQQATAEYKPYKSAYAQKETAAAGNTNLPEFYCKYCEKQLNGPIPYKAHISSKAHKEEVELYEERT